MYAGKTLFAQLMDFLPWSSFERTVQRYGGDHRVRTQLSYRESLRDIETCLSVQAGKLYHMGFREPVRRATLADANEARDWRIYADFAQRLIARARTLYAHDSFGIELDHTVYVPGSVPGEVSKDSDSAIEPPVDFRGSCAQGESSHVGCDAETRHGG